MSWVRNSWARVAAASGSRLRSQRRQLRSSVRLPHHPRQLPPPIPPTLSIPPLKEVRIARHSTYGRLARSDHTTTSANPSSLPSSAATGVPSSNRGILGQWSICDSSYVGESLLMLAKYSHLHSTSNAHRHNGHIGHSQSFHSNLQTAQSVQKVGLSFSGFLYGRFQLIHPLQ